MYACMYAYAWVCVYMYGLLCIYVYKILNYPYLDVKSL